MFFCRFQSNAEMRLEPYLLLSYVQYTHTVMELHAKVIFTVLEVLL